MIHARYVGPRADLLGQSALTRPSGNDGEVLAQFDFPRGTKFDLSGKPLGVLERIAHLTSRDMVPDFPAEHPECFNWHPFPAEHFVATADQHEVTAL